MKYANNPAMRRFGTPLALCALVLAMGPVPVAQTMDPGFAPLVNERTIDGYTVRWNASITGFIPQTVLDEHGLEPSGRGVLNVVVLRDDTGVPPQTVEAEVSAIVTDLLGHSHPIDMIEVEGNGRTSYFGSFDVDGREQLRFDLSVRPPGEEAHTIEFQRRFFTGAVGRR